MTTTTVHTDNTVTRVEIKKAIYYAAPHLKQDQANLVFDEFFEMIKQALSEGHEVHLRGFGKFKLQKKKQRIGRNPKTLKDAIITPRRALKFSASPILVAKMNNEDHIDYEVDE